VTAVSGDSEHLGSIQQGGFPGMIDGHERVTGRVPYTINFVVPRMLHANLLWSTAAHPRNIRIDSEQARTLPGVAAVLTGADLACTDIVPWFGPIFRDRPILAIGKVRYVGEPVVAVAMVDLDTAREAVDLVDTGGLARGHRQDDAVGLADDGRRPHRGGPRAS
jgi:CO/xanthine dehydrogenase Mo-binding subunit